MIALLALKLSEYVGIRAARPLAWALVFITAVLLALAAKSIFFSRHDAKVIENHEATTSAKLERSGRKADASAAQRAEVRRRAEAQARKDFDNATAGVPDNGLSDRQRIDLCRELLEAGTDTALIPECGDVRTGAQTGS
jgi:hypothetical protein